MSGWRPRAELCASDSSDGKRPPVATSGVQPKIRVTISPRGWPAAGVFTSGRGSGEGALHCGTNPSQNTENSGNELKDLLQRQDLSRNDPSKRTVSSAPNEPLVETNHSGNPPKGRVPATPSVAPTFRACPELGEGSACRATARRSSRQGSAEGSLLCSPHPSQNTANSGNELTDLLQASDLAQNAYTKRTISSAPNELVGGVHESDGPASPSHEPTPHPSCSDPRERRSPTPHGRGLLRRTERAARDGAFSSRRGSGEGSLHCCTHPAPHTKSNRNELHDLLQAKGLTRNGPQNELVIYRKTNPSLVPRPVLMHAPQVTEVGSGVP
jgi:hypothetical protein